MAFLQYRRKYADGCTLYCLSVLGRIGFANMSLKIFSFNSSHFGFIFLTFFVATGFYSGNLIFFFGSLIIITYYFPEILVVGNYCKSFFLGQFLFFYLLYYLNAFKYILSLITSLCKVICQECCKYYL